MSKDIDANKEWLSNALEETLGQNYFEHDEKGTLFTDDLAKELIPIINSLYISRAEVEGAIGDDEPETGFGKRDGEYEMKCHRNKLRAEIRTKLNLKPLKETE